MRKIKTFILCLIFMFSVSLNVFAANPIDTDKKSSLTLHYKKDGLYFENIEIRIYKIADVDEAGRYTLTSVFDEYKVNIHGITSNTEWKNISQTLSAYITADRITPYKTQKTDSSGFVTFENIETGMYLVSDKSLQIDNKIYFFESFIALVPIPNEDGEHIYEVSSNPKSEIVIPTPEKETYKIIKQWKDTGFEEKRPENVYVDIYKDGEIFKAVVLNSGCNWTYSWESEKGSEFIAVERDIPEEYTVTVSKNGTSVIITNVYEGEEPTPGKPGDEGAFWKYTILSFVSGVVIIALSIGFKRRKEQ